MRWKMIHSRKIAVLLVLFLISIPLLAGANPKKQHQAVPEEQECADCHTKQQEAWQSGKHGPMGVQCVVCHGSLDETFFVQPPVERCNGCHAAKVADVSKKKSAKISCASCHDKHTLAAKSKTPFHKKGGN